MFCYIFDLKLGAVFFGIGPASSTYPCVMCKMPKSEFENDTELEGGPLRTVGEARYVLLHYFSFLFYYAICLLVCVPI